MLIQRNQRSDDAENHYKRFGFCLFPHQKARRSRHEHKAFTCSLCYLFYDSSFLVWCHGLSSSNSCATVHWCWDQSDSWWMGNVSIFRDAQSDFGWFKLISMSYLGWLQFILFLCLAWFLISMRADIIHGNQFEFCILSLRTPQEEWK